MNKQQDDKSSWLEDLANTDIRVEHGHIEVIEETALEKNQHKLRRHIIVGALGVLLITIVGWAGAGIFLQKIQFGDNLASARQSDSALAGMVSRQAGSYKLTILHPGGEEKKFSLKEMGFQADAEATIAVMRRSRRSFANRLQWWRPMRINLVLTNNPELNAFIAKHATATIQPAKDAKLSIHEGKVQLTNSTPGRHYGLHGPVETLTNAASSLRSTPLKLEILSTRPAITSRQLAPHQTKLQNMLRQDVVFTLEDREVKVPSADIAKWIEIVPTTLGRGIDINVNGGKVLAYITELTAPFIHPAKPQVEIVRSDGSTAVLAKGVNGADVMNKKGVVNNVVQSLLGGIAVREELAIQFAPFKKVKASSYSKWIEVDLTRKRMYAYEKHKLKRSFLVSAGAPETPTVTGQYAIYAKIVQQDMSGLNVDGSSYFQPKVSWVNYFYGNYAVHGNYWRPLSHFGNFNTSHGCVSLPDDEARWIFDWAPIGTPVITHT